MKNAMLAALLAGVSFWGCAAVTSPQFDLDQAIGLVGAHVALAAVRDYDEGPSPQPNPSGICQNCNGVGKVGDGRTMVTCPVCDGSGKASTAANHNPDCACVDCDCDPCQCDMSSPETRPANVSINRDSSDMSPTIYFFTANWCPHCPPMHALANQLHRDGHVTYVVDFDERPDLVRQFAVDTLPQFVVVRDGQVIRRVVGVTTKERVLGQEPARTTGARQPVYTEPAYHVPPPQQTGRLLFRRGFSRGVCGPGGCR